MLEISILTILALPPDDEITSHTSAALSFEFTYPTTTWNSFPISIEIDFPMPLDPPVTKAIIHCDFTIIFKKVTRYKLNVLKKILKSIYIFLQS